MGSPTRRVGWYSDPTGQAQWRYWDGQAWTTMMCGAHNGEKGIVPLNELAAPHPATRMPKRTFVRHWADRHRLLAATGVVSLAGLGYVAMSRGQKFDVAAQIQEVARSLDQVDPAARADGRVSVGSTVHSLDKGLHRITARRGRISGPGSAGVTSHRTAARFVPPDLRPDGTVGGYRLA